MSKDKGQKTQKKSPADKSTGNPKAGSSYKNEGKSDDKNTIVAASNPKPMGKSSKTS